MRHRDIGIEMSSAMKPVAKAILDVGVRHQWVPAEGSRLDLEIQAEDSHWVQGDDRTRPPIEMFKHAVFVRCFALADYVNGIGKIAAYGGHVGDEVAMSAAPVARAALEASAYLYWYCETGLDTQARIRRMCVDLAHQMNSRHRLDDYAAEDGLGPLDPGWDDFAAMLDVWGVRWDRNPNGPQVRIIDERGKVQTRDAALKILAPLMPSKQHRNVGAFLYSDISDIAHASLEGLLRRAEVTHSQDGTNTHVAFSRHRQLAAVAGLQWALYRPLEAVMSIMGWEHDELTERYAESLKRLSNLPGVAADPSN